MLASCVMKDTCVYVYRAHALIIIVITRYIRIWVYTHTHIERPPQTLDFALAFTLG